MRSDDIAVAATPNGGSPQLPLNSVEEFEAFEVELQDPDKFGPLVMFITIFNNEI